MTNTIQKSYSERLEQLLSRIQNNACVEDFNIVRQEAITILQELRQEVTEDFPLDTNNIQFTEDLNNCIGESAASEVIAYLKKNNYALVKRDTRFKVLI